MVDARMDPVALIFVTLWRSLAGLIICEPPTYNSFALAVAPDTIVFAVIVVEARMEPVALILATLCTSLAELITSAPPIFKELPLTVEPDVVPVAVMLPTVFTLPVKR